MTAFVSSLAAARDTDSPVTQTLADLWYNNPLAIAEGDSTAPVIAHAWHPYNKVTNGDANTGLIYDFGVSGAVATVTSPDFADGWEYMFRFVGISHSSGANQQLFIEVYREATANYGSTTALTAHNSSLAHTGTIEILRPRDLANGVKLVLDMFNNTPGGSQSTSSIGYVTASKILRARFSYTAGNIDAGQIYMYRRRCL